MKRIRTLYKITSPKVKRQIRFAVASDIHCGACEDVTHDFEKCDAVLVPGDLVDRHTRNNEGAYRFLKEIPERFTVFYSLGNHERKFHHKDQWMAAVRQSRIILLDNESREFKGIHIGGLSSVSHTEKPDLEFLERFEKKEGFRLLLCHHPEMYRDVVSGREIDCTLSGHAHGGQIQIRGRGLYAPGQGLFPELTHGIYDGGRLIISRGMTNNARPRIPRINNPCELIVLEITPGEKYACWKEMKNDE